MIICILLNKNEISSKINDDTIWDYLNFEYSNDDDIVKNSFSLNKL